LKKIAVKIQKSFQFITNILDMILVLAPFRLGMGNLANPPVPLRWLRSTCYLHLSFALRAKSFVTCTLVLPYAPGPETGDFPR
jgi:hypothetical protein